MNFSDLGINKKVLKAINSLGFTEPTPIQEQSIPVLLAGERDYIGLAQTGTGKTAAFGLPLIHRIDSESKSTQVLILCPTRELCLQITKELQRYAKYIESLNIVPVYGGVDIKKQIKALKNGAQIVVGTPGRLLDHVQRRTINLSTIRTVVLDEADEMLDMGFQQDIDSILQKTPASKKTWLFSATMPDRVGHIAKNYMKDPVTVTVGSKNSSAENIEHHYFLIKKQDRYEALKRFITYYPELFGIVFCRTKRETKDLAQKLIRDGYNADVLHGDLSQFQRDMVMKKFRNKQAQLLIATDVAARGIDVSDVTHVIHYALPDDIENYTHRSGRTARAGKSGISLAIVDIKEAKKIRYIEQNAGIFIKRMLVPTESTVVENRLIDFAKKINDIQVNSEGQQSYHKVLMDAFVGMSKEDLIARLTFFVCEKFLQKDGQIADLNVSQDKDVQYTKQSGNKPGNKLSTRLFINIGEMDGFDKTTLIKFLQRRGSVSEKVVKNITVKNTFSFFSINNNSLASQVVEGLRGTTHNNRKIRVEFSSEKGSRYNKSKRK
ncbi:MAG: DEAD/DEAH box helicase [Candidatus Babeliales bacterium]